MKGCVVMGRGSYGKCRVAVIRHLFVDRSGPLILQFW